VDQTIFSCSIARHEGDVDFEVMGDIDRSSAGQFRNRLLSLAKEHPASIVIHMCDLSFVDSSCVAVLIEAWRFTHDHGIELTVTSPAASIRQAFEVGESGRLLTCAVAKPSALAKSQRGSRSIRNHASPDGAYTNGPTISNVGGAPGGEVAG